MDFFVYAFLGWCTEVSYAALVTGRFVNRGFLNGPACPIYGFGVLLVVGLLTPLRENALLLFLGSVVLTSTLEWAGGFALEKLFRQRWWDYSDEPFNIGGYICLRFSIAWGLACLLVMEIIHPAVLLLIRWLPRVVGVPVLCLLGAVMVVDVTATVKGVIKMNRRLEEIDALAARIREELEEWKEEHSEDLEELRRRLEKLLSRQDKMERRLMRAFPKMRSERYKEAMERLKRRFDRFER